MSDEGFGYGSEDPSDWSGMSNAVMFVCRQLINEMDTAKLVMVKAVHGGGEGQPAGTVDVLPLVSQVDGRGYGTPHGVVPGLPWQRVQGGKNGIICDPVVGDIGYVVAMDRDISKVKSTKAAALPGSRRTFNIADGVYVGGALNAAPTCYLLFTADGHFKFVDTSGNVIQSSANGIAVTPASGKPVTFNGSVVVTQNLQLGGSIQAQDGTEYAGDIQTTGRVIAGNVFAPSTVGGVFVSLLGHIHSGNNVAPTPGH